MNINTKGTHMVVIVDMSSNSRLLADSALYYQWLDALISYANSHLLMSSLNNLTIIGTNSYENKVLYPLSELNQKLMDSKRMSNEGQYEAFHRVVRTVKSNLKTMSQNAKQLSQTESDANSSSPLMSGAIAMALCRIQRFKEDHKCSRIVIMSCTSDQSTSYASQYMNFMNCFFAAQKMGVCVDACIAGDDSYGATTSLLQQGCDLTDGTYLRVPNISSFLEYLLWCLLPDAETRTKLVLPERQKVSHSATAHTFGCLTSPHSSSTCFGVSYRTPRREPNWCYPSARRCPIRPPVSVTAISLTPDLFAPREEYSSGECVSDTSDLFNGTYLRVPNISSFLEYLLWCLLPDAETRTKLVLPERQKVSHSAACFCHRNIIDTGFVCSVCLSIFCSFSPICSTCHTIFKLGPIPQHLNKSKKKIKIK
ncbi:unnamed protein product [Oppiella nova]|uniref:General transcription factor IIH subunit 3 n=1 Tax=Oppiella nova TaxID=334625 RepID=A0A7R9QTK4_9ACAR|nr:unnamed protein product [Oppiella nova]CAG2174399.1 unnamed protein product [Oppiella nova]